MRVPKTYLEVSGLEGGNSSSLSSLLAALPTGEALCLKVKLSGRMLTMAGLFDVWSHGPGVRRQ